MNHQCLRRFFFIALMVAFSLCHVPGNFLHAQPVLHKIEAPEARRGQAIELTLRGKGFLLVKEVEAVQIGELELLVLDYTVQSDEVILVRTLIPEHARPGRHKIGIRVSGETFKTRLEGRLERKPDRTIETEFAPEIEVLYSGTVITDGGLSSITFDTTIVGTPVMKTFRVRNRGTAPLKLSNLQLPPGFSLDGTFPENLDTNRGALFYLQMEAVSEGWFGGTLQFNTNDSDENPFDIQISGIVNAAPESKILDRISPPPSRPELQTVEAVWSRPGEIIELTLRGHDFLKAKRIDSVQVGDFKIPVMYHNIHSNKEIRVQVRLPDNVTSGSHEFAARMSGTGFAEWFQPTVHGTLDLMSSHLDESWFKTLLPLLKVRWQGTAIVGIAVLFFVALGALHIFRKSQDRKLTPRNKSTAVVPLIQIKPANNFSSQQIKTNKAITPFFELRLKPVLDYGKVDIQMTGDLICEESVRKSVKNASRVQSSQPDRDDLQRIEGIGPIISNLLQTSGITTFAKLAATDKRQIQRILDKSDIRIADPATWPGQARLAEAGEWDALNKLQEKLKGGRVVAKNA